MPQTKLRIHGFAYQDVVRTKFWRIRVVMSTLELVTKSMGLPQDQRDRYDALFHTLLENQGNGGDMLTGKTVRSLFLSSGLSIEELSLVWKLSDRHRRSLLDSGDFYIALRLVRVFRECFPY